MSQNLELYREYPEPDEQQWIDAIDADIQVSQRDQARAGGPVRRGFNAKQYGGFLGRFEVGTVPEELRVGLFSQPGKYDTLVKFGGGSSFVSTDQGKTDPSALSIKILDTPGKKLVADASGLDSHDFNLISMNSFFVAGLRDFVRLTRWIRNGQTMKVLAFYFNPFAGAHFGQRLAQFRESRKMSGQFGKNNLAEVSYWTTTPFGWGNKAAKFKLVPRAGNFGFEGKLQTEGFNLLRENIEAVVAAREISWDFCVQLQTDPVRHPIEDASIGWDEQLSPPISVATLTVPRQQASEEVFSAIDQLPFHPWHAPEAHRPLGGLNRGRKSLYALSFGRRAGQYPKLGPSEIKQLFSRLA